jgi:hypothetical protein
MQQDTARSTASKLALHAVTRSDGLSCLRQQIRSYGRGRRFETFRAHQEATGQTAVL